jgi:hypothetical protein
MSLSELTRLVRSPRSAPPPQRLACGRLDNRFLTFLDRDIAYVRTLLQLIITRLLEDFSNFL